MSSTVTLCKHQTSPFILGLYIVAVFVLTLLPLVVIIHTLDGLWLQHRDLLPKQREITVPQNVIPWLNRRNSLIRQLKVPEETVVRSLQDGPLSCRDIEAVELKERLGRGVTKDVYRGVYRGESIAVKVVTSKVEDIKACMRRKNYHKFSDCFVHANYKLMKEVALSMQLDHPNVIKSLGMCTRSKTAMSKHGMIAIYEIGDKTANSVLKKLPWDTRLDMSIEIADLLDYLQRSPLGSLAVWDFKTRQFVIVKGKITLVDLDDLSAQELSCEKHTDCNIKVDTDYGRENIVPNDSGLVPCVNSTCYGLNSKFNVISAMRGLVGQALLSDPPPFIKYRLDNITMAASQGQLNASQLKGSLQQLIINQ
ncbi:extracellular tyrosine-protein kinase PKDCC-like [Asterias rubens]|uniref:extracellular tyrosine-protein kinase PKDCC-like n=1 Tax=Asterias rubens TaxID=7604 RepID=UPI0014555457|nr:extracellular tyrosine-protein kinase PKDCC-like [Asterias rubens]